MLLIASLEKPILARYLCYSNIGLVGFVIFSEVVVCFHSQIVLVVVYIYVTYRRTRQLTLAR